MSDKPIQVTAVRHGTPDAKRIVNLLETITDYYDRGYELIDSRDLDKQELTILIFKKVEPTK